jgi:3-ketosteroid 9alpha-monooxygenase subunit B
VISIVKAALSATARPVRVLYANRSRSSVIFSAELDSMTASSGGRLEVVHHYDDVAGFLDTGAVRNFVGTGTDGDFYVCGPQPFMDLVESVLFDAGVAPERVHIERFGAAPLPPDPDPLASTGVVTETVTIIMKGRKHRCAYQSGHTLLETARRAGLKPPFSCESGTCATCMAIVHDGSVTMRVNEALTPEEVDEGWVLTCQALPTSPDITFEYES